MLIYFIYFIFLAILAIEYEINPFKSSTLLIFVGISLVLLAGLRSENVTRDYLPYMYSFDSIEPLDGSQSFAYFANYEPGFIGIVLFFKKIFVYNYGVVIMLFYAFTSLSLKIFSFNKFSLNPFLVLLIYFSHYFIIHEMTQIRIGLATGIFLISLFFYFKKNYKAYAAMILLATLFHYSALGFLILLFFKNNKFNRYVYSALLVLSIFLAYVKLPLFNVVGYLIPSEGSGKFNSYSGIIEYNLLDDVNVFNAINIAKIFCSIYLMFFIPKLQLLKDEKLVFFLKCNILSIFTLSLFSGIPLVAFRISELYGIASVFTFAYLAKYLPFYKYNVWIVVAIAGLLFYLNAIHGGLLGPYKVVRII